MSRGKAKMTFPVPQTLASSLWDRITPLLEEATHIDKINSFVFNSLFKECDRLAKTDIISASLFRGTMFGVMGKDEDAEYQFANVKANGDKFSASAWLMLFLSNRCYAKRVIEMADEAMSQRGSIPLSILMRPVASMGGFSSICKSVEKANQRQEVLADMDTVLLEKSRRAHAVMQCLNLTDNDVSAAIEVAGEIIRERRLIWLNPTPDIDVFDRDCDFRSLMIQFRVGVSPKTASEMNWELMGRQIDLELDKSGLSIGFVGTKLD